MYPTSTGVPALKCDPLAMMRAPTGPDSGETETVAFPPPCLFARAVEGDARTATTSASGSASKIAARHNTGSGPCRIPRRVEASPRGDQQTNRELDIGRRPPTSAADLAIAIDTVRLPYQRPRPGRYRAG